MKTNVLRQVLPFILLFLLLIVSALAVDYLLHFSGLNFIDYYFGILGSLLILISFVYSLRKRSIIKWGKPKKLLLIHEYLSWIGALLILIHAGIHLNALLAWIASLAMLVAVISGLTGKYILRKAEAVVKKKKENYEGQPLDVIEKKLYYDSLSVDIMKNWRKVHIPVTSVFFVLAIIHIIVTTIFGLW
jgi:hypothetical protein